ncbi:hypothetical protein [Cellulomonas aerilata]|uniref:Uncharacterized protein n=1 Tax=Cellulomonas aerilata TaxID=515326 RepID=A0A512DCZ3_9CELL|nr:hypothetical protein [Cellulomonas aerilata]GEO34307.1 hypothetical protein CAE01nite_20320 [Cellulomonas aerilata]
MTTFEVPLAGAAARVPAATPPSTRGRSTAAPTGSARRGAAWRDRARRAVTESAARLGDRLDARTLAEHTPTCDDSSAWCTHHWGGLQEWPCPEYTAARASLDRRRPR